MIVVVGWALGGARAGADDEIERLEARLARAAARACRQRGRPDPCGLVEFSRTALTADIARYRMRVQVGPGDFDAVTVHRIVRERRPGLAADTEGTYFFLHGSANHFVGSMLPADGQAGLGLYLARRGVDVWGLDLRWVPVPRTHTDFAFMRPWDFATHVDDIRLATRFARQARRLTGQDGHPLNLAGASLGASLAYAVANAEAAEPEEDRDVGGLMPIDTVYKLPPESPMLPIACATEANNRAAWNAGGNMLNSFAVIDAGTRALSAPNDPSPVNPALTNAQFALNLAAAPTFPPLPNHIFSVVRDASGLPVAGTYTEASMGFAVFAAFVPWRARRTAIDLWAVPCGQTDTPYDDHLAEIAVPVLYTGLAGGFGADGLYVNGLLGSDDVSTRLVQLEPDGQGAADFAHLEWLSATDAETLVWRPIRRWIAHHDGRCGGHDHHRWEDCTAGEGRR